MTNDLANPPNIEDSSDSTIDSFLQVVKERLSSPLYGVYILTWVIYNWKVIYITFFTDVQILDKQYSINTSKIEYIDSIITKFPSWLCPLIATIIIILGFPFLNNLAFRVKMEYQKVKRKIFKDAYKSSFLSKEESLDIISNAEKEVLQTEKTLKYKTERIRNLTEELSKRNSELLDIENLKIQAEQKTQDLQKTLDQFHTYFNRDKIENLLSESLLYKKQEALSEKQQGLSSTLSLIKELRATSAISGKPIESEYIRLAKELLIEPKRGTKIPDVPEAYFEKFIDLKLVSVDFELINITLDGIKVAYSLDSSLRPNTVWHD